MESAPLSPASLPAKAGRNGAERNPKRAGEQIRVPSRALLSFEMLIISRFVMAFDSGSVVKG